ncbi:MAG: transglycosylase SLT domain-containing protein [Tannerellaceae bacterium]|nr:transglycosylase SLT domain-containing protein [Tannerellaceae bacterium]
MTGCGGGQRPVAEDGEGMADDLPGIIGRGEIRAVTLYSSTSYFLYRTEPMGYEYELIHDFASAHNLKLAVRVADNSAHLLEILQAGEADVAAYPVVVSRETREGFIYCGREDITTQVLIQPLTPAAGRLRDVTRLIGKEVYVRKGSPYHERLTNLDRELGGGILIHAIDEDLATEDLIEMVSAGRIPYTVSDDRTARLNKTYYRNIDISLEVSFRQRSSWIVRREAPQLAAAIDEWASGKVGGYSYKASNKRYFELSKKTVEPVMPEIRPGHLSPYDSIFRKKAYVLGWDWRLIASLSYQESHFNNNTISWAGAQGLMGIMPSTAYSLGISQADLADPAVNIGAGVEVLRLFRRGLGEITDSAELIKFTIASYNAGIGHIYDARRLAAKYGKDPSVWDDNVASFILLKHDPAYYNDTVCRYGYLRGRETFNYVKEILDRYHHYTTQAQPVF